MKRATVAIACLAIVLTTCRIATADWNAFVVRNSTTGDVPPTINDTGEGGKEFVITLGGQKAAWGTADLDGKKVGDVLHLAIRRTDDRARFTAGSGPYCAPYINIWVTDGAGKFAVLANEPSDAVFQPLYDEGYDLSWTDLADKPVKVYENTDKSWLPNNGVGLTFADVANMVIQAPTPAQLAAGWAGLGTGAPRELGTNLAYGINWVFGDTLSNYVTGDPGYVVSNPLASEDPHFNNPNYVYHKILDYSPDAISSVAQPEFSPDGTKLLWYERTTAGVRAVKFASWDRLSKTLGAATTVITGTSVGWSHWSPDGQYIGYRNYDLGGSPYDMDVGENVHRYKVSDGTFSILDMPDSEVNNWNFYGDDETVVYWGRDEVVANSAVLFTCTDGGTRNEIYNPLPDHKAYEPKTFGTDTTKILFWDDNAPSKGTDPLQTWTVRVLEGGSTKDVCGGNLSAPPVGDGYGYYWAMWGRAQNEVVAVKSYTQGYESTDLELYRYDEGTDSWQLAEDLTGDGYDSGELVMLGSVLPDGSFVFRHGCDIWYAERQWHYKISPLDLASGTDFANGLGGYPFGSDPDMPPPIAVDTAGPDAYESGCWWSDVQGSAAGGPRDYTALRLAPREIFGRDDVTIGELAGLSYWTRNLNTSLIDWQIKIYTQHDVQWYGYRFNFTRPAAGDSLWHRWATDSDIVVSDIYDKGNGAGYISVPGSGLLSDLVTAGYGDEKILFIDVIAGFASSSPPVDSLLDGIELRLADGSEATIDLINPPVLTLDVQPSSLYVQPGENVVIDLDVSNLLVEVKACQAIMAYNSDYLLSTTVAPGGLIWDDLIYEFHNTGDGELDTAIGVKGSSTGGTTEDSRVAVITLVAQAFEGTTTVVFRSDVSELESTFLSDMLAQPVWPSKLDSQTIVIDGTDPTIAITSAQQFSEELIGTSVNAVQGVVAIVVEASDALAGIEVPPVVTVTPNGGTPEAATYVDESPAGSYNYVWTVTSTTPNGTATINATVEDRSGNEASATPQTFNVNKNQITGNVELQDFVGASREVTFVANGGARKEWTILVDDFAGGVGTYTLTDVPAGTLTVSAKTGWNLRSRVITSLDGDGQGLADFTGADKLLGGDLNETNSVNVLDYTIMKTNWLTMNAVGDITGDGAVNVSDYTTMKSNWFKVGDPE